MRIEWGSWRDPAVARDVTIVSALGLVAILVAAAPLSNLVWLVLAVAVLGLLAALLMLLRHRSGPAAAPGVGQTHPGINMSRISPAGFPGLVFVAGFIWMFWAGLPGLQPLVIALAVLGGLTGLGLVILERGHRLPTDTPLGLSRHRPDGKRQT